MGLPSRILPTKVAGVDQTTKNWLATPALTAEHLSRGKWLPARHLVYLSDRLAQIRDRQMFLICNMPPRHGKSELISHWLPIWYLKNWPWKRVILASYQSGFASEWGGDAKNSMVENENELGLSLMTDTKAKAHWRIKGYGGGMMATGIGGPLTGRGGDLIIIDDPIKSQKEALSETYRRTTKEWYRGTLRTRLQPGGSIIILMTRWHQQDLAGWLQNPGPEEALPDSDKWETINLKALAGENDPLGRKPGQALWPEMFNEQALIQTMASVGTYWASAEYQGEPRPEEGNIIKEGWFKYFDDEHDPFAKRDSVVIKSVVQIWDTAYEQKKTNDRSACITWADCSNGRYILDVWAGRPEFPDLQNIVKQKYAQWKPDMVLVEPKASGSPLIQQLRRDTQVPIRAIPSDQASNDKVSRMYATSPIVENGQVFLRARAPWLAEFMNEVCTFPAAQFDDIADCFSYGLLYIKSVNSFTSWQEAFKLMQAQKEAPVN